MGSLRLFTAILGVACGGQTAPPADKPASEPAPIYVTPDAAVPVIVGAACNDHPRCGPGLTCDATMPGGACVASCSGAGTPCANGVCVEYPKADLCRASCTTNADCRADEGYACDPVWKGCVLANAPTIAPLACAPLPGFGRDPTFAPSTALGIGAGEPAAAITDEGGLVAVFEREDHPGLAVARLDHTGRLDGALDTSLAGSAPALVRDGAVIHLVTANRSQIALLSSRDRGRTWSAPRSLAEQGCMSVGACTSPALAVGSDPRRERVLYVAYSAGGGIRMIASRTGGATFTPAITALPGERASLAVSGDGVLHVAALRGSVRGSYGAGDHDILYATSSDGGRSFTRPQLVSRSGERLPFYFGTPRIEVDSARKWIYIAYTRGGRDGKWDLAIVATKDKGKTWARSRIGDDPPCATHFAPQLALDPTTGSVHVAWYDSRGNRFAHGVCVEGLRACRQLGRINDAPFAGLSLARHGATAASETTALIVDAARRTLHAVWSQPVAADGRIFHAKAKLPQR